MPKYMGCAEAFCRIKDEDYRYNGCDVKVKSEYGMHEFRYLCCIRHFENTGFEEYYAIDLKTDEILKVKREIYYEDVDDGVGVERIAYTIEIVQLDDLREHLRKSSARHYDRIKDITRKDQGKLKNICFGDREQESELFIKQKTDRGIMLLSVTPVEDLYIVRYAEVDNELYNKHFGNTAYIGDILFELKDENSELVCDLGDKYCKARLSAQELFRTEPKKKHMAVLRSTVTKYTLSDYICEKEEETHLTECWYNLACCMRSFMKDPEYKISKDLVTEYIPMSEIKDTVKVKNGAWASEGLGGVNTGIKKVLTDDRMPEILTITAISCVFLLWLARLICHFSENSIIYTVGIVAGCVAVIASVISCVLCIKQIINYKKKRPRNSPVAVAYFNILFMIFSLVGML